VPLSRIAQSATWAPNRAAMRPVEVHGSPAQPRGIDVAHHRARALVRTGLPRSALRADEGEHADIVGEAEGETFLGPATVRTIQCGAQDERARLAAPRAVNRRSPSVGERFVRGPHRRKAHGDLCARCGAR
jgi:hypothetical protein